MGAESLPTIRGHTGPVQCVVFSPDGKTIASASLDKTVRIWDAKTGAAVFPALKGHERYKLGEVLSRRKNACLLAQGTIPFESGIQHLVSKFQSFKGTRCM
jgi:WD40 repeat protein